VKTSAKVHQFGNNPPEVTIINSEQKEPALRTAAGVVIPTGAIIALVGLFFPAWIQSTWFTVALAALSTLMPVITALFTRGHVWSPASVKELLRQVDVNLRDYYTKQNVTDPAEPHNPYKKPDKI
jgi:hypothetical protein